MRRQRPGSGDHAAQDDQEALRIVALRAVAEVRHLMLGTGVIENELGSRRACVDRQRRNTGAPGVPPGHGAWATLRASFRIRSALRLRSAQDEEDFMGLLDGRRALIFGVANDHSIAWGIAKALHAEGAVLGLSSVESLLERRVRPLARQLDIAFVEPCDVTDDAQIARVFDRWREMHGDLDILVHALAFRTAKTWTEGSSTPAAAGSIRTRRQHVLAHRAHAGRAAAVAAGGQHHDADISGRRARRASLQRDGRRKGRAGGQRAVLGGRPRAARDPGQRDQRRAGAHTRGDGRRRVPRHVRALPRRRRRCARTSPWTTWLAQLSGWPATSRRQSQARLSTSTAGTRS